MKPQLNFQRTPAPAVADGRAVASPVSRLGWPHHLRRVLAPTAWLRSELDRLIAEALTRRALARLDDRALKDIGLSRSDIDHLSRALGRRHAQARGRIEKVAALRKRRTSP
jgi:uncharacterized protein YjiS (DUF1127 family)